MRLEYQHYQAMLIHIAKKVYKFTNYEEVVCKVKQALEKTDEGRKQEGKKIPLERNFIRVAKQLKKFRERLPLF